MLFLDFFLKNQKMYVKWDEIWDLVHNYFSSSEIQWQLVPPCSPYHGGIWKAAIKSAKYHILRIVCNHKLLFEEFYTVLTQIEAVLNSRPLCAISNDPSDLTSSTPGYLNH